MSRSVICLVSDIEKADTIVKALQIAGFSSSGISMLMPDSTGFRDTGYEKHSKAPEGTSTGAATGSLLGGALGWLAGIGALAIPGLGPFIAAGPIMAALSGAAIGGTVGGIAGGLIGLGIPEYEAKQYEGRLQNGNNILISVHTENAEAIKRAEDIFKAAGATDINCITEESIRRRSA